jgi:hypothetical protein
MANTTPFHIVRLKDDSGYLVMYSPQDEESREVRIFVGKDLADDWIAHESEGWIKEGHPA